MPTPTDKQAEVILAGCGAPKRGMGWYHAVQLLKGKCPSAVLCHVIEPWFLGGGTSQLSVDCCSHLLKLFGRCALAVELTDRTKLAHYVGLFLPLPNFAQLPAAIAIASCLKISLASSPHIPHLCPITC